MKKIIGILIAVCLSVISLFALFGCQSANTPDTGGNDTGQTGNGGKEDGDISTTTSYTANTSISDVINDPVYGDWGRMIFPVNSGYYSGSTLGNLRLTWYNNINVAHTVEICNYFKDQTLAGNQVFYDIYTDAEKAADPRKADTGLFFFRGEQNAKFAVTCAGAVGLMSAQCTIVSRTQ